MYTIEQCESLLPETEESRVAVTEQFPYLTQNHFIQVVEALESESIALRIGVVCLGGQTPGAHNVIDGLLRGLSTKPGSVLFGFLGRSSGLFTKDYFIVTEENFALYRNTGGIDFLGREQTEFAVCR